MISWKSIYTIMAISSSKYPFYEGTFSYSMPEKSKIAKNLPPSRMGWGRRAVEMRANKTRFDKFENDKIGLNDIMTEYRVIQAFNKIKNDILVCGVGFIALAGDRALPFTSLEATGEYDWQEQNLANGVAVFQEKQKGGQTVPPNSYVVYQKNKTVTFKDGSESTESNNTGRPLMGMFTYQSTTKQPLGRTVLSKTVRDSIIDASRTKRQAMIAAYHYNTKVDVLLGVDSETEVDVITAQTGDILKVGANENGQIPQIAEFAQHAMTPFSDSILISAQSFCTDTKLSLANLGISTAAPQSPEGLEIVGDDLRDDITDWQEEIGEQLKYFAVTLWMYKNNVTKIDVNLQAKIDAIKPVWRPIFKPDTSKFGDGLFKMAQIAPAIVKQRSVWRQYGLSSDEIDEVIDSVSSEVSQIK